MKVNSLNQHQQRTYDRKKPILRELDCSGFDWFLFLHILRLFAKGKIEFP